MALQDAINFYSDFVAPGYFIPTHENRTWTRWLPRNIWVQILHQSNSINANQMTYRDIDMRSSSHVAYPGLSCSLFFTRYTDIAAPVVFGRDAKRSDRMHFAKIEDIEAAGWKVIHQPEEGHWFHSLIVPTLLLAKDPDYVLSRMTPTDLNNEYRTERELLAMAWTNASGYVPYHFD